MKRILSLAMVALLALFAVGCGGNENKNIDLTAVMSEIKTQVKSIPEDMMDIAQDSLITTYYGIETSDYDSYAVSINTTGINVTEIAMFKASSDESAKNIEQKLLTRKSAQENQMKDYLPEQYNIVKDCDVTVKGKYVTFFVSEDAKQMNDIFNSFFE